MKNGFIKVCAAVPKIRVADPQYNVAEMLRLADLADREGVRVLVFPELGLTGATCGDLFFSESLIDAAHAALERFVAKTRDMNLISVVGLPLAIGSALCNVAAVCRGGQILGFVPKSYPSEELGDSRYFCFDDPCTTIKFDGQDVPVGRDLLFTCAEVSALRIAVEIGSDLAAPLAPAVFHAAAGATLICNPAAICDCVGADTLRRDLIRAQTARTRTAYLFSGAGEGESTTDLVFGGHALLAELGKTIAERPAYTGESLLISEIDVLRVQSERRRANACFDSVSYQEIRFSLMLSETELTRVIDPHPFIPEDPAARASRCESILTMQTAGLKQRVERAFAKKLVLGISGGLDSTLALLVMVRAIDALGRSRKDILAVTMPCFGTTKRTKNNATVLCEELGVDFRCVDIFDAVNLHFRDIGHDPDVRDVTYENSQARERTQILMDIANDCGGMVIGTGDLSELALGWATYNGDHMSMYAVNAAIPKTLVRHLVAHAADCYERQGGEKLAAALRDVLGTPVSPELLPADESGEIAQKTEDLVGPYELHDFYLYHMLRYGASPTKLYRLARAAFESVYDEETLRRWLKTFIRRFFTQQFKRSCMPDGPKIGSIGVSPRGQWKMPSDASAALWMAEAERL
ncbi:MAG: NAD(+) synthase [Ruminococcaceae bacterium]|nr:NAD(+) synthase [Oscillospiraceae bacterium]